MHFFNQMGVVTTVLLVGVGLYGLLVGLMFLFQGSLLFYPGTPSRALIATPATIGLEYQAPTITAEDGVRLSAWYVPGPGDGPLVIFAHGNAGNISHRLDTLRIFHQLGLTVLMFDYRGYGESEGRPGEEGTYRDMEAMWRYVTEEQGVPPDRIILAGRSLGGAIAAWLGARTEPGGLIIESTFTSLPDLAADLYPILPARWLTRFRYSTEDYLRKTRSPVLILHGRDDEIAPFAHGQRLYAAANEPKTFVELRGGHNDAFLLDNVRYREAIGAFLRQHFGQFAG